MNPEKINRTLGRDDPSVLAARNFLAHVGMAIFSDSEGAEMALALLWLQGEKHGIKQTTQAMLAALDTGFDSAKLRITEDKGANADAAAGAGAAASEGAKDEDHRAASAGARDPQGNPPGDVDAEWRRLYAGVDVASADDERDLPH